MVRKTRAQEVVVIIRYQYGCLSPWSEVWRIWSNVSRSKDFWGVERRDSMQLMFITSVGIASSIWGTSWAASTWDQAGKCTKGCPDWCGWRRAIQALLESRWMLWSILWHCEDAGVVKHFDASCPVLILRASYGDFTAIWKMINPHDTV